MAEATRLEQSLQTTEHQRYDLAEVVRACVSGYELAYAQRRFELQILASPLYVSGQPDLAAQLLDKLVANAADFALPEAPIRIVLELGVERALLRVINQGPPLPGEARERLFESMVSVRPAPGQGEPHLGLGLYIARLIAEFHGGWIKAENLPAGDGVTITAAFRLA
jgi:signal transduction histidine kinase